MRYNRSPREFPRECSTNDVFTLLKTLMESQELMMAAIDDLTAAVTAAVNELNVLAAKVQDLTNQLAGAQGAATTEQLEGLASQLTTATNAALGAQGAPVAAPATDAPAA